MTVTLLDGLVLVRSAFHHSLNYRSVVIFGKGRKVEERDEKRRVLYQLSEHVVPGRGSEVRQPSTQELDGTAVVSIQWTEASAKIRTGPPKDDEADYALSVWAGELPLRLRPEAPTADPRLRPGTEVPAYLTSWASTRLGGTNSD